MFLKLLSLAESDVRNARNWTDALDVPSDLLALSPPCQRLEQERYGEGVYLVRLDQHIAAYLDNPNADDVETAHIRAMEGADILREFFPPPKAIRISPPCL